MESRTTEPPTAGQIRRRRRRSLGEMLAIIAMIAANLALIGQIGRSGVYGAWTFAAIIVATNLALCLAVGVVVRFRLIPLMAMFSTAALTEALLWQSATSGRGSDWIVVTAVLGAILIVAMQFGLRSARDRQRADR